MHTAIKEMQNEFIRFIRDCGIVSINIKGKPGKVK